MEIRLGLSQSDGISVSNGCVKITVNNGAISVAQWWSTWEGIQSGPDMLCVY